ncbi:MAG: PA14 domain-containing protein [Ginsengibacter sp.]
MINELSIKYQKPAAWFVFVIFSFQMILPVIAYPMPGVQKPTYNYPYFSAAKNPIPSGPPISTDTKHDFSIKKEAGLQQIRGNMKTTGPGPGQPEMQTFQSVNTSNMVDLFTGDFSYNIPLLDVGGYPVNIHYTGGISMDQEASWVGLGWNINPGTISRNMRGIPDDFDGQDSIVRTQHVKPNKTAGVTVGGDVELVGLPLNVGASLGIFKNNYNGWGIETGINAAINSSDKSSGSLTEGLSLTNNSQTGLSISPSISIGLGQDDQELHGNSTLSTNYNSRTGISALQLHTEVRGEDDDNKKLSNASKNFSGSIPNTASLSFAVPSYIPTINMPYTSTQYALTVKLGLEKWTLHPNVYADGYVSQQEIKPEDQRQAIPAIGYLYYTEGNNQPNALLDVNREKETQFNVKSSPVIAIPQYTYDLYSISGEGTGGMFRPYRGDIGFARDASMRTKSATYNGSVDLGFGAYFHVGTDFIPIKAITESKGWQNQGANSMNNYIRFQKNDTTFQSVYFRNPGEKTSNTDAYYHSIGDDALMRIKLGGDKSNITALNTFTLLKGGQQTGEIPVTAPPVKINRDKRTQLISYLTADEASQYGLDKTIRSYKENTIPTGNCSDSFTVISRVDNVIRKKHHLSEIDVTNSDGRRYIYGLPAYNVEQKEVTFSVDKEIDSNNFNNGLVSYSPAGVYNGNYYQGDNSPGNNKGKENYYTQDSIPAYAHDFLLTGVLSPDYVDITGDGITPDDIGDGVKFNYTRVYGADNNFFDWRTPTQENKANYNEGLKTYSRDDKGTYLYGKKEVWYLNSIESKTMIAIFKISNNRKDAEAEKGENGGLDDLKQLRRLDEIDLYAKADLVANGTKARPIKTVHFVYSYTLCPGIDPDDPSVAKLTLDSIWFSYNANYKGRINPYVFHYSPGSSGTPQAEYNPSYNPKNYDRWGNFKDPKSNPGGLSNVDYPYSVQDSVSAAQNASAWEMTDIQLPSSGRLKITYESDDYAYVQNKRACELFQIAGFASDPAFTPTNQLYTSSSIANNYVFVNTDLSIPDTASLRRAFLGNNDTIYFKIAVQMPSDMWGSGYEFVPGYGVVAAIGFSGSNTHQFWLKLKPIDNESPISKNALQFLRLNLPSKAYPGSETGNDLSFSSAVSMLASSFKEIANTINGFDKEAKIKELCKYADLSKSFIRLTSPIYKKYGGGYRVKRVELFDNWNKMTGQKEASYGQEYDYTTTEKINGESLTISSGVASYEPNIGNEENPFREPIPFAEQLAPLAPVNYTYVEKPIGEAFYPSASVGYSRVIVRTINRKAKSANGWQETTFYTTKDFPTLVDYTVLDDYSKKRYNPILSSILKINAKNFITLSQGFKIELNDMNGKMKSEASYAETDSLHPVKASYYFYKEDNPGAFQKHLNNSVPVLDSLNGHIDENGTIGKDIEVMVDMREQSTKSITTAYSPNVDVIPFFWFPLPVPSKWGLPQKEQTMFRSAATVKIIHRYGILDSVVVIDKGSVVSTKNLVYDGETGDVIVSRTNNEFNDPVYNFNYPAYWAYSGMAPAYQNSGTVFYNKNIMCVNGKLFNAQDGSDFNTKKFFESGDELWVRSANQVPYDPLCSVLHPDLSATPQKLWVVDASKGKEKAEGLFLIDKDGVPYTGVIDSLKIIRSGKRNMSAESAGSIVSLADPVREITPGNFKIVIDSATSVIHTTATSYKDLWQVENTLFQKDTVVTVYDTITVQPSIDVTTFREETVHASLVDLTSTGEAVTVHSPNIAASTDMRAASNGLSCGWSYGMLTKSAITFDTSAIPPGSTILSATLNLTPRIPFDLWFRKKLKRGKSRVLCGYSNTYDWSKATNYYAGQGYAALGRITTPWNIYTSYNSIQTSSNSRIGVIWYNYSNLNITSLMQEMVNYDTKYGLMFEIPATYAGINFLDFCSGYQPNINNIPGSGCSDKGGTLPCTCQAPVLTITYRIPVDTTIKVCRANISDTATNPYRWGILGNWRADKAYSYYGDRKENDASITATNVRKEGVLKDFTPFWQFTDSTLSANPDTSKWVWNSSMSKYNRKGFEIENYDPLDRYNSGLYGYNETLPVAVSQNSKYRELLFDGFEDYNYKAENCVICPSSREFDFTTGNSNVSISNQQSHTGLYSLKINAGFNSSLTIPVSPDTLLPALSFKIDSSAIYKTYVTGKGTGLSASYYGYLGGKTPCGTDLTFTRIDTTIDFMWGLTAPFPAMCPNHYTVTWQGYIQAPSTGVFTFYGSSDYMISAKINNQTLFVGRSGQGSIPLVAGNIYPLTVQYTYSSIWFHPTSSVHLYWSSNIMPISIVPKQFLYNENMTPADTVGSYSSTILKYCINANNVKQSNMIRPTFSPVQGDHLIVSGWARIDATDCNSIPAIDDVINASFDAGGSNPVTLQRTGTRIEGWQRYEGEVTVPVNATTMTISITAPSTNNIFLDDIRVQPFNSSMKGFVYDPVNLRLMAELDENNYATFYEYDDDGTLVRVKKETEQGIKTIQETRSALIKDN